MRDPSRQPDRHTLIESLGQLASLWDSVIGLTRARSAQMAPVWHFAWPKIGWSLRLVEGARILVYLTPGDQQFQIGLVLGAKAVAAARQAGISPAAHQVLDSAPRYAEGLGVRVVVTEAQDIAAFSEILEIKCSAPTSARARVTRPD